MGSFVFHVKQKLQNYSTASCPSVQHNKSGFIFISYFLLFFKLTIYYTAITANTYTWHVITTNIYKRGLFRYHTCTGNYNMYYKCTSFSQLLSSHFLHLPFAFHPSISVSFCLIPSPNFPPSFSTSWRSSKETRTNLINIWLGSFYVFVKYTCMMSVCLVPSKKKIRQCKCK